MLNCVICDDDNITVKKVKRIVEEVFRDSSCVANISTYTNSISLVSDILEYKPIDLAILDIEMPKYNGMQIAKEIKKRFPDCCVIFLTSYIKYAVESYELQVFRYTPKTEIDTKLAMYIKDAISMLMVQKEQSYMILKNDNIEQLPYRQMLCIRKDGKYSVITCVDKREIRIRKPLNQVMKELNLSEFILIDRGCIVNIALISRIYNHEAICKNEERFPISRAKLKETKSRITKYWGEKI